MIRLLERKIFLQMASFTNLIKNSPSYIQKLYFNIVPFERRYGKIFKNTYNFLLESESWSYEEKRVYQLNELKKLINHCYKNVPYYTKLFNNEGIVPNDIKEVSDLKLIPYLTKDLIRANKEDLIAKGFEKNKIFKFSTSGSTGKKLIFYGLDELYKKEAAFVLQAYKKHGATLYDEPSVWLRRYVPPGGSKQYSYYDFELKRLYMSAYHLSDETIFEYLEKINDKKFHTLVAYPSSIFILANLCEKHDLKLKYIKKIHVSSEMMQPEWREKVIKVFGIEPVAHYGAIEKVSFMYQLEGSNKYFEHPFYGVNEYIKNDLGNHDIVATGFLNYYMPFLRYRTEDSVILNKNPVGFDTVLNINGRTSDILISKSGSQLPGVNFYSWIDKTIPGVSMFQIIQNSTNEITFTFVPSAEFNESTINNIKLGLESRLGKMNIKINKVREIKRNESTGKIKTIINQINNENVNEGKDIIYQQLKKLKEDNGTHSPSINTIIEKIPDITCNIDACFISNPYATDLFFKKFQEDMLDEGKLKKFIEMYPQQNQYIAEKISNYLNIDKNKILVGNGAIEIIEKVMNNLKGKIFFTLPTFSSYYEFNKDCEIISEKLFHYSSAEIISRVDEHKVNNLLLVNPNNPTGFFLDLKEIEKILEALTHLDNIIIDESFIHYTTLNNVNTFSATQLLDKYSNLIIIKSMAKDFGVAGIRAGYALMHEKKVRNLQKKGFLWNSNGFAEYFFDLLVNEKFVEEYEESRNKYIKEFQDFGAELRKINKIKVHESKANFYLIELLNHKADDLFSWLLIEKGIYIRSMSDKVGFGFDYDNFVRIAGKTRIENKIISESIKEFLQNS